MKNLKIGIIGGGVVGQATARSYLEHVAEVRVYDLDLKKATHGILETVACDIVFVCLPTPQKAGSLECGLSALHEFFNLPADNRNANLVLRSTVPIGTTRMLREKYDLKNLVHSPEFLTARCAQVDAQMPSRNIVGLVADGTYSYCRNVLTNLYRERFPQVPILAMTSDESEAVKLFQNGFFAVKVAYWNEVRCLADKLGLNWNAVMNAILADGRICPSHTQVPGPDGKFGFGGTCLPKDLASLVSQMPEALEPRPPLVTEAALNRNKFDRLRLSGPK